MGKWMNGYLEKLEISRQENLAGGGQERIEQQHALGKLTARERIELLVDPGSFEEIGSMVRNSSPFELDTNPIPSPGDGVVMGIARVSDRQVMIYATDFTVMSGAVGDQGAWKIAELVKMAGQQQIPIIGIWDSAGSRISLNKGAVGQFGLTRLIKNYCHYSGVIPRISLVLGPCTGPWAQVPVLSDFCIMNEETAFLWWGGEIQSEDAGDADFHMRKSGQCHLVAESDEEAIGQVKDLLQFLPQNCWEGPEEIEPTDDPQRRDDAILDIMPDDVKFTYDIHDILELLVDNGEVFELQEDYAPNMFTGFARFDGMVAGIAASNPEELSGIMEPNSSDKYDRFIMFLDAFNIPLITMSDSTAFPPGDRWERMGVIRHGAKNLHGYSHLTTQKISLVLRRSYGGSNIVMGCSCMGPDFIYAWPTAEFAPTGPEMMVNAVFNKELEKAKAEGEEKYEQMFNLLVGILRSAFSVMNLGKSFTTWYTVHEVIDPRETRSRIIGALRSSRDKLEETQNKRRYIKPA